MSTGIAGEVIGGEPEDFLSTELDGAPTGADGNDLTAVTLLLDPPEAAQCLAFDFQFLSEEYPDYVGSSFNDIFTAELISAEPFESEFYMEDNQVIAPHNFAYDDEGNYISINTVLGLTETSGGTGMNGATEPLVAVTPIAQDESAEQVAVILSVQDIGDSIYDSAALVDNFRWIYSGGCHQTVDLLTDSDGDSLPDEWERNGIDYSGDGTADLPLHEMGADPNRPDIFVEVDWMERPAGACLADAIDNVVSERPELQGWDHGIPQELWCLEPRISRTPNPDALQDVVDAFAVAPYTRPDGTAGVGINLHIDAGPYSPSLSSPFVWSDQGGWRTGGNAVPWKSETAWHEFYDIMDDHFDDVRRDSFHYFVYVNQIAGGTHSGEARGAPGADVMMNGSFFRGSTSTYTDARRAEAGTFMHELGHNLGLGHGGPGEGHGEYHEDENYRSVMNRIYQLPRPAYSPFPLDFSRHHPFNDWENLIYNGGGIGGFGAPRSENAPEPPAEPVTSFDGVGDIEAEGPAFFAAHTEEQQVLVDVQSRSEHAEEFVLNVASSEGDTLGEIPVSLDGFGATQVAVNFDASGLAPGDHVLNITLWSSSHEDVVSALEFDVYAIDLSDEIMVETLDELVGQAVENGLNPELVGIAEAMVETEHVPTPTASPSPSPTTSPTPEPSPTQSGTVEPTPTESPSASPIPSPSDSDTGSPAPIETSEPSPSEAPTPAEEPTVTEDPTHFEPSEEDLVEELEGEILLDVGSLTPGEDFTVHFVDSSLSSEVGLWLFAEPQHLGDYQVVDGSITATLGADVEIGEHQLAAYDVDSGSLLGWTYVSIKTPPVPEPSETTASTPEETPTPSDASTSSPAPSATESVSTSSSVEEATTTVPPRVSETAEAAPTAEVSHPSLRLPTETVPSEDTPSTASPRAEDENDSDDADGGLPVTGTAMAVSLLVALALIGAGTAMLVGKRRRSA
ncbi:choice-of-anchor L domain-containing protein [Nesterenkonia muleiensis]|uniref:choice-of-anchor L domain-containing protein n=1 Tax=Nesterenkonia muleiensis TaxID=2282648 RepID=UPI0013002ECF|nr:choice-of-anchor L domain-containing protein [Nesterenkonia muleiensis]